MVAYEDLVVALTNWRVNQGLPTGAEAFAAFETGSVDLALPVADPVELNTSEVLAIEDESALEGEMDADMAAEAMEGDDAMVDPGTEPESLESFAEADAEADAEAGLAYDEHDGGNLDYGEETAYGDVPEMESMEAAPAEEAMEAASEEDAPAEAMAEEAIEPAPLEAPQTEEVDVLAAEEAIDQEYSADDMPVEEFSAEEAPAQEVSADDMPAEEVVADDMPVEEMSADDQAVEEEVDADGFEAEEISADGMDAEVEAAGSFDQDEMPTRFGDDDEEGEATVMGIGVDELVPPDEG